MRAIEISTSGEIHEVTIDGSGIGSIFTVIRPTALTDRTTDLDGRAVLLVFPQGQEEFAPNPEASKLAFNSSYRDRQWLVGDVYVVGEDPSGLIDLPERLGDSDIREYIEYESRR